MIFIFVIKGQKYDPYETSEEWTVAGYEKEETAKTHLAELLKEVKKNKRRVYKKNNPWDLSREAETEEEWLSYLQTHYWIEKIPLVRHLDEYLENEEDIKEQMRKKGNFSHGSNHSK